MIHPSKEKLIFKDFDFYNEYHLNPEVKKIYEKYKEVKPAIQHYSSTKSLRSPKSKSNLQRQQSSPYLVYRSLEKGPNKKKSERIERNKSLEIIKSRNSNASSSFARLDSKKKIGYGSVMNLKKVGSTNYINASPSKPIKGTKKLKENSAFESTLLKDKKIGETQFLKKKKIVYNYLKNE